MTRHAQRCPAGGHIRARATQRAHTRANWQGEEEFPVLDENLFLPDAADAGGRRRARRQTRENRPQTAVGAARAEGGEARQAAPVRERAAGGRDDAAGRGHDDARKEARGAQKLAGRHTAGRHTAGRGGMRQAAAGQRLGRQSVPGGLAQRPDRQRQDWQLVSSLLPEPDAGVREGLDRLGAALARVRPLSASHARSLPQDVATLSRLLTVERAHLHQPYWASPALISAYLYYFLPWNVLRQARLLAELPLPDPRLWLEQGRRPLLLDMGSGPLSLPLALWLARPQWRGLPLVVLALDASSQPLELGRNLLHALADELGQPAWEVRTVRAPLGQAGRQLARACGQRSRSGAEADAPALWLASAANVLNEMLSGGGAGRMGRHAGAAAGDDAAGVMPSDGQSGMHGDAREESLFGQRLESVLDSLEEVLENGDPALPPSLLVVEPGTRLGGTTVMRLRGAALERGLVPLSPCTHAADCPLERGRSGRGWCHVTFDCAGAPDWLAQLSEAAGLAKDSLSLAPLLLSAAAETVQDGLDAREAEAAGPDGVLSRAALRVLSAPFAVPGLQGRARYACGVGGLALLGDAESLPSGGLVEAVIPEQPRFDRRSGAVLLLPEAEGLAEGAAAFASSAGGAPDGGRFAQKKPEAVERRTPEAGRSRPADRTPSRARNEREQRGGRPERKTGDRFRPRKP